MSQWTKIRNGEIINSEFSGKKTAEKSEVIIEPFLKKEQIQCVNILDAVAAVLT